MVRKDIGGGKLMKMIVEKREEASGKKLIVLLDKGSVERGRDYGSTGWFMVV